MNKLQMVREFSLKHNIHIDRYLELETQHRFADYALSFISWIARTIVRRFQTYANKCQKNGDMRLFRSLIMLEEFGETCEALVERDEIQLADGLADLLYVVYGTGLSFSIPLDEVFMEVHMSNMTKKVRHKEDERLRDKGPNWVAPNIENAILKGRTHAYYRGL